MSPTSSEDKPFIGGRPSKIKKKKKVCPRGTKKSFFSFVIRWGGSGGGGRLRKLLLKAFQETKAAFEIPILNLTTNICPFACLVCQLGDRRTQKQTSVECRMEPPVTCL